MTSYVIARDSSGVQRCRGWGWSPEQAINQCRQAARDYIIGRPDIKALYLVDDQGKPIMINEQMTVGD